MNRFERMMAGREYLLADGATGTNLFAMGLKSGDAPELWNVEHPDRKPADGMWQRAAVDLGIDLASSYSIGDGERDAVAGKRAGTRAVLLAGGAVAQAASRVN